MPRGGLIIPLRIFPAIAISNAIWFKRRSVTLSELGSGAHVFGQIRCTLVLGAAYNYITKQFSRSSSLMHALTWLGLSPQENFKFPSSQTIVWAKATATSQA